MQIITDVYEIINNIVKQKILFVVEEIFLKNLKNYINYSLQG